MTAEIVVNDNTAGFTKALSDALTAAIMSGEGDLGVGYDLARFRRGREGGEGNVARVYRQSDHDVMVDMFVRAENRWLALSMVVRECIERILQLEAAMIAHGTPVPPRPAAAQAGVQDVG